MTEGAIRNRVGAFALVAVLIATAMTLSARPAAADCNSAEVYVEILGLGGGFPTGCIGPSTWDPVTCPSHSDDVLGGTIRVGLGACVALP